MNAPRLKFWLAFLAVHAWAIWFALHAPGYPLGDIEWVYPAWIGGDGQGIVGIDREFVYPFAALGPLLLAGAFGPAVYAPVWLVMVALCNAAGFAILLGRPGTHVHPGRAIGAAFWLVFILAHGPVTLGRIDAVTVPIALIGALLLQRRPAVAAAVLAVATWIKIWPAALLAAAVIVMRRRARIVIGAALGSAAVVGIAAALGGGRYLLSFVSQQTGRGLQIEAPVSSPFLLIAIFGGDAHVEYNREILTHQIVAPGASTVAALMTPLLAVAALAVAAVAVRAVRAGAEPLLLIAPVALAFVAAMIFFNKVGSPQFMTWLIVPIVLGLVINRPRFVAPAAAVLGMALLSQLIYPFFFDGIVMAQPVMVWVLVIRNACTGALLVWALWEVRRLRLGALAAAARAATRPAGESPGAVAPEPAAR